LIEFHNVSKVYNNGTEALHNINLTVDKGEFVFIVGSSGAGKSTFLKLVMCEERPNSGQIIVDGVDVTRLPKRKIPYIRRKMGIVFQDFRLIDHMTVYDNVAFAMRVVGASARSIRKRVPYILSLVGLQHKAKHYPTELSGGERQRVGLARALVNNPSMIIADEPTGNIDPALSFEIVDLLSEINRRGTTVLMVTHEHSLVKHFHKRIIQIHSGEIVADTADMADTYAPPEQYSTPEEAVENDDDYAEYDNQEVYEPDAVPEAYEDPQDGMAYAPQEEEYPMEEGLDYPPQEDGDYVDQDPGAYPPEDVLPSEPYVDDIGNAEEIAQQVLLEQEPGQDDDDSKEVRE
jgi:cell division transport system ATP-binding protein